ncbi:46064_t:CDS:2 [Gigaspora margarita]|uniref:46064_t:CDS:1 n=1 Tax=Gigaspora margarita TaxID=4874 RepID=A0ABM8VWW4_GIGMA|nr:46064_t:CDS:2 [Gigaspora margarita]
MIDYGNRRYGEEFTVPFREQAKTKYAITEEEEPDLKQGLADLMDSIYEFRESYLDYEEKCYLLPTLNYAENLKTWSQLFPDG